MSRHDHNTNDPYSSLDEKQSKLTGSPAKSEPVFIAIGFLRRAHGVHGEMIMDVLSDFPERIHNRKVYLGDDHQPNHIRTVRPHNRGLLVSLDGCDSPEDAAAFRNTAVYVRADQLPKLPEGEYYHHEILGLRVINEAGEALGVLEQILETGANEVYLVRRPDGSELLLPVVEEVILDYDLEHKQITVRPQEWV